MTITAIVVLVGVLVGVADAEQARAPLYGIAMETSSAQLVKVSAPHPSPLHNCHC